MSRWLTGLSQVSNLLEQLDDQVENVAEERAIAQEEGNNAGINDVDEILAKRGFSVNLQNDDHESKESFPALDVENIDSDNNDNNNDDDDDGIIEGADTVVKDHSALAAHAKSVTRADTVAAEEAKGLPDLSKQKENDIDYEKVGSEKIAKDNDNDNTIRNDLDLPKKLSNSSTTGQKPTLGSQILRFSNGKEGQVVSNEVVKEVRILRRHVVKLNATLEEAEQEITALRGELETAAKTISQENAKAKNEKEVAKKKLNEELAAQKVLFDEILKDKQARFEEEITTYRNNLSDLEVRRKREGGDWNKEVSQAMKREQDMNKRLALLEDEKSILLSQISTLQSQQQALGSRLESLTGAAENSMARERQAEDRLDSALSQHAKQISQRQAREVQLEKTIQELNSALVLARDNRKNSMTDHDDEVDKSNANYLKAQIDVLRSEVDTVNTQLAQEKERSQALQQQLRAMSKESTQEASAIQIEQLQYQRQVADLQLTITTLESKLRDVKKESPASVQVLQSHDSRSEEDQIKLLSDEVLRLRDKLAGSSSESFTLRARLQSALQRAAKAEEELSSAASMSTFDAELIAEGAVLRKRGRSGKSQSESIRAAMRLHASGGERSEQIGKVVDAVDAFAATTGKYLRRNPLARAGFILYLVLVHTWTFVLLFFHAHHFETRPGNHNSSAGVAIGPNALVEAHKQLMSSTNKVDLLQIKSEASSMTP